MMIEANELRIGNWIYNDLNQRITVTDITYDGINGFHDEAIGGINYEYGGRIEIIQPIPLKKEWLVRFGFEKVGNSFFKGLEIFEDDGDFFYGLRDEGQMDLHIKYVHQLQNFWYALTNEELILQS